MENLSPKIFLKKSIIVVDSDGFKLPLKRSFDYQGIYKLAFLKQLSDKGIEFL